MVRKIGLLFLMMGLVLTLWETRTARAATGDADLMHAIATAPQGLPLDQVFTTNIPGSATRLLDSPTVPKSIAQITPDSPNQVGAIWSHVGTGRHRNQFDLTREMEMGFWFYFGDRGANAGEGMAFVVHNSPQRDQALGNAGQALGVWGTVPNVTVPSDKKGLEKKIAQTAIQNSWALELDTHVNADITNLNGYFDFAQATEQKPHIAYASPADPSYYLWRFEQPNIGYGMRHYHANPIVHGADGTWHHFSIFWHPKSRYLEYYYDDVDPVTNQRRDWFNSDTFQVKPEDITVGMADPTQAFWGITGATGPTNSANNLVMIDHSSSLGKVASTVHLDNGTTHREIASGDTVAARDQLTYRYEFDYQPARDDQVLAPLTMTMPVPAGLDVDGGRIVYDDQTSEVIDRPQKGPLKVTWSKGLTKQRHRATVTVTGRALPAKQTVTRPAATASFYGDNYQTSLTAPAYQVTGGLYLRLTNLGSEVYVLKRHETATVNVRLRNGDLPLSPAELETYPLEINLNGQVRPLADFAGQMTTAGEYQLKVPAELLNEGDNVLKLQAKGHQQLSNTLTVSLVRSPGTLGFEVVPQRVAFASHALTGQRLLLGRHQDWRLAVRDERGAKQHWKLQVALTAAFKTTTDRELRGQPLFAQTKDQHQSVDAAGTTVIDKVSQTDNELTWLDQKWTAETGILLDVAGDAVAGDYQGTLQWTLENAE